MNVPTDTVQPPYNTAATTTTGKPQGISDYIFVIGFFVLVILLLGLTFASYICKRSRSPPPPIISFGATIYTDADTHQLLTISPGLDDDILVTFPTFLYSQAKMPRKGDTPADANASGCSICLADYKPADVVRLLPECGHLFHVKCIDTWLKVHPTCPVCRNSPVAEKVRATMTSTELTGQ